ncbi:MAG: hypothetical protein ABT05_06960 [Lautropia sp. SCN 66-9]|nr:MAG: hypothetical protein ABT05_06960 [Lautropia sp. SCN 66-9]
MPESIMTHADTTDSPSAGRRRRRWLRLGVTLLVLGLLAGGGWWTWQKLAVAPDPNRDLLVGAVQRGDIEDLVSAIGTLQPRDYVDVGAQVSGQLKKIHIEVGSVVKNGDLLAEIDPTLYAAKVDASRAQLRNQRAQMLDREAQLTLAEINFKRQTNLKAADATTEEALQNAQASLQSARAQIEALKAQIEQTESSLRAEEANLDYARIYAPMSGTVVSITARQGQTLNTNQQAPTLLRIADLSTMTVQTQVSEADVGRLSTGMPVYFTTLGSQGRRWQGELKKIEPTPVVQNNVVLYNALFDVPNVNQSLMTQMTAQVFFIAASAQDTLLVPMSALTLSGRPQRGMRPDGAAGGRGSDAGGAAAGAPAGARGVAAGTAGTARGATGATGAAAPAGADRASAENRAAASSPLKATSTSDPSSARAGDPAEAIGPTRQHRTQRLPRTVPRRRPAQRAERPPATRRQTPRRRPMPYRAARPARRTAASATPSGRAVPRSRSWPPTVRSVNGRSRSVSATACRRRCCRAWKRASAS